MSLRTRLLLAVSAVALVAFVVADIATYRFLQSFLYDRIDQSLEADHIPFERASFGPNRGVDVAPGIAVQIRDGSTGAILQEHPYYRPGGAGFTPKLPTVVTGLKSTNGDDPHTYLTVSSAEGNGPRFRVRVSVLPDGSELVLGEALTDTTDTLNRLLLIELAVTAAALAAAVGLGWWLVRVGLSPLGDVERTANAIATGKLDERVPGETTATEVGRLSVAINTMLGHIEDAFAERDATEAELRRSEERLRRFVADASHELRTPLAAVSAYAELFERGARERPEDLARVMTGIRTETGRMGQLVQDLLLLARLDDGRPLERKPLELVSLVAEAIETARAVGPEWPLTLVADQSVDVVGDATRLRQVLDNLLANVRVHTPPGTAARIRVTTDGREAIVEVADNGPGLRPEETGRVFERFYRADPSRSRQHGSTGLGLGIVDAIAAAHGGSVAASTTWGGGATFTLRLPVGVAVPAPPAVPNTPPASMDLPGAPTAGTQTKDQDSIYD